MARKAAARHGTTRRGAAGSASEEEIIVSNSDTMPGSRKPAPEIPGTGNKKSSPRGELGSSKHVFPIFRKINKREIYNVGVFFYKRLKLCFY